MDSSCKLEYTAGIETESWLIGELTFKTAKGEQTEILTVIFRDPQCNYRMVKVKV